MWFWGKIGIFPVLQRKREIVANPLQFPVMHQLYSIVARAWPSTRASKGILLSCIQDVWLKCLPDR